MKPIFLPAFLAAGLVATTALAAVDQIADIDVIVDVSAIQNARAATYWGTLAEDLETAILARVNDRMEGGGASVAIDVEELSLASAFERSLNLQDAVIVGTITVTNTDTDQADDANFNAYDLSVSLEGVDGIIVDGQLIASPFDVPETYDRLVNLYADQVVARLDE